MLWRFALAVPCFWAVAALNVLVCLRFFLRVYGSAPAGAPVATALAVGQKKDAWLLAGIAWTAMQFRDVESLDLYLLAALPVLVWLLQRSVERLRSLRPAP